MIFVLEMGVEFDYVWVVEVVEDFQLEGKLRLHFVLADVGFEQFFQSEEETCFLVSAEVDLTELA